MTIVSLRNRHNFKHSIGFDLVENKIVELTGDDIKECGDFCVLADGMKVGFLNASMIDPTHNQFLFFIGGQLFSFDDESISCEVNYINENTAKFKLFKDGNEIVQVVYSRKMNADYGGWLVGNWETEKEKDIFCSIKEILERVHLKNTTIA